MAGSHVMAAALHIAYAMMFFRELVSQHWVLMSTRAGSTTAMCKVYVSLKQQSASIAQWKSIEPWQVAPVQLVDEAKLG